jgi:hypothetical protein
VDVTVSLLLLMARKRILRDLSVNQYLGIRMSDLRSFGILVYCRYLTLGSKYTYFVISKCLVQKCRQFTSHGRLTAMNEIIRFFYCCNIHCEFNENSYRCYVSFLPYSCPSLHVIERYFEIMRTNQEKSRNQDGSVSRKDGIQSGQIGGKSRRNRGHSGASG